jgi:decaprenylphospho-beta-D-erythro-pentofuranosid-2-ulose 2-reductase
MPEGPCRVLIIGATSAIAEALARRLAARRFILFISGRNPARLEGIAKDLAVRGASSVHTGLLDVNRSADHEPFIQQALDALGRIDVALLAHGTLPDQPACQLSASQTL